MAVEFSYRYIDDPDKKRDLKKKKKSWSGFKRVV